ncbi:C-reactive protein-like [Rhinoraja longicauda]
MKPFVTIVLVMCIYLSGSDSAGLQGKSLIFPKRTATSYIRVFQRNFSKLTAFTICFRVASDASWDYSLISYATPRHHNELLIWQMANGWVSLYLGNYITQFSLPKMNSLLRHICMTWESRKGAITVWVNGERSLQKIGTKGLHVKGGGQFILGQEQDRVGGGFDCGQCLVGEMNDVNMWSYVLKPREIMLVSDSCCGIGGNIIHWGKTKYTAGGSVVIENNKDCKI